MNYSLLCAVKTEEIVSQKSEGSLFKSNINPLSKHEATLANLGIGTATEPSFSAGPIGVLFLSLVK